MTGLDSRVFNNDDVGGYFSISRMADCFYATLF